MAFELTTDTLCWQTAQNIKVLRCFLKALSFFCSIMLWYIYISTWASEHIHRRLTGCCCTLWTNCLSLFNEAWTDLCFPLSWEHCNQWNRGMVDYKNQNSPNLCQGRRNIDFPSTSFGARRQRMPPLARKVTSQWCSLDIAACGKSHLGEDEFLPKVLLVC